MVSTAYEKYETEYDIHFDDEYEELTNEKKADYDAAYSALLFDEDAIYAYYMTVNLALVITTLSILIGVMLWEFVLPLFLGGGQTLGKKIFGICLVKSNCVKTNHVQLLIRSLLGKFTIETMIPAYVVMMFIFNSLNLFGLLMVVLILTVQAVLLIFNENRALIHDLFAGTVVVDAASTRIFETEEDLIEYKKMCHAEEVNKNMY